MIRMHWSYTDLYLCPQAHLEAISDLLGEQNAPDRE
jgi:hypothetical protein